jgi:ubiquinone/menaquinone biosynthesis C-methylase UbiE
MPLMAPPPRAERAELIDSHEPSDADFAASFADIARVNRFLGGTAAVLQAFAPLVTDLPPDRPVRVLDVATGSADIPRALVDAARRGRFGAAGRRAEIVATDNHPKVLGLARTLSAGYPEITVAPADAFALPFGDASFDIALCSLAFHHFGPEACIQALRELARVSRVGFVVNDLRRDRLACALIWLATRAVGANRLTRHDAPLSVLKAYTLTEYVRMADAAGIREWADVTVRPAPLFRAVIVGRRRPGRGGGGA